MIIKWVYQWHYYLALAKVGALPQPLRGILRTKINFLVDTQSRTEIPQSSCVGNGLNRRGKRKKNRVDNDVGTLRCAGPNNRANARLPGSMTYELPPCWLEPPPQFFFLSISLQFSTSQVQLRRLISPYANSMQMRLWRDVFLTFSASFLFFQGQFLGGPTQ